MQKDHIFCDDYPIPICINGTARIIDLYFNTYNLIGYYYYTYHHNVIKIRLHFVFLKFVNIISLSINDTEKQHIII